MGPRHYHLFLLLKVILQVTSFMCTTELPSGHFNPCEICGFTHGLTAQFTKPPDYLPLHTTVSGESSCWQLQFTTNGHFSIPQELYQVKPGSRQAGGFVNCAVNLFSKFSEIFDVKILNLTLHVLNLTSHIKN